MSKLRAEKIFFVAILLFLTGCATIQDGLEPNKEGRFCEEQIRAAILKAQKIYQEPLINSTDVLKILDSLPTNEGRGYEKQIRAAVLEAQKIYQEPLINSTNVLKIMNSLPTNDTVTQVGDYLERQITYSYTKSKTVGRIYNLFPFGARQKTTQKKVVFYFRKPKNTCPWAYEGVSFTTKTGGENWIEKETIDEATLKTLLDLINSIKQMPMGGSK